MGWDGDLFSERLARSTDPVTSFEAAERIIVKLRDIQLRVYVYFEQVRRATILDVEYYFNDHGSTYRTRVSELVDLGLLEDSGVKRLQEGSNRVVWKLVVPK